VPSVGLPKEGRKRRKGLEGADVAVLGVYRRRGRWVGGCGRLVSICADRGVAPRLHQSDGCAVLGSEPSFGIARRVGSAASMDAIISPVRGLHPLRLLWPEPGRCRGAQAAPLRESARPESAKPGWNPTPPGFVASGGRGIDPGGGGGLCPLKPWRKRAVRGVYGRRGGVLGQIWGSRGVGARYETNN